MTTKAQRSVGLEEADRFGLRDTPEGQELGRDTDENDDTMMRYKKIR
ncbi:MAG: hypothetical protein K6A95_09035 [Bacteroidales bacterium]|nr:hypothetical protein [Bacteroidales bacterium]